MGLIGAAEETAQTVLLARVVMAEVLLRLQAVPAVLAAEEAELLSTVQAPMLTAGLVGATAMIKLPVLVEEAAEVLAELALTLLTVLEALEAEDRAALAGLAVLEIRLLATRVLSTADGM